MTAVKGKSVEDWFAHHLDLAHKYLPAKSQRSAPQTIGWWVAQMMITAVKGKSVVDLMSASLIPRNKPAQNLANNAIQIWTPVAISMNVS